MNMREKSATKPKIIRPFDAETFRSLFQHVRDVRMYQSWHDAPYHDKPGAAKFNRWCFNPPLLKSLHHSARFRNDASRIFRQELKPSYSLLSMYGHDGVCPPHVDRPQCRFTIDLLVHGGEDWPLYVEGWPCVLKPGEAVCYTGEQVHYRNPMSEDSRAKFADLAFFHWVAKDWAGPLD